MNYSQSPPLMTAEEMSSGRRARDLDDRSDRRMRPNSPTIRPLHSSRLNDDQAARRRPSIGRRMFRALTRFFIAVLIGVGATLGWQSYGDAMKENLVVRLPTLAWLLSVSTAKPLIVAATPPDPTPRLETLASSLDDMRRSVEQIAAKQEQMAQNIVALQAVEEDIRQKMSFTAPSPSQQAVPIPPHKPQQPWAQSSSLPRPPPPAAPVELSR